MFERFTDRARRVVVLARQEARQLDHDYVGPEHLLLGLIREGESVAAKALVALGVDLEAVGQQVKEVIGRGERTPSGHVPFSPQAKHVLEMSLREAIQLGHNYIGTEHLLLGLIREDDEVAARILAEKGATMSSVRRQVVMLLHGYSSEPSRPTGPTVTSPLGGRTRRTDEIRQGIEAIMIRLTAIEEALEIASPAPPGSLTDYSARIAQVRKDEEAALEAGNFKQAAMLRDQEKRLTRERDAEEARCLAEARTRRAHSSGGGASGAEGAAGFGADGSGGVGRSGADGAAEVDRLRREVERLQMLLREHGVDPGDDLGGQPGL